MDISPEHGDIYFQQKITRQEFDDDVVKFVQDNFNQKVKPIHKDEDFQDRLNRFEPEDFLGKAWFSMYSELKHLDKQKSDILPPQARAGYSAAVKALGGLWLHEQDFKRENNLPRKGYMPPLNEDEFREMRTEFRKYKQFMPERMISNDGIFDNFYIRDSATKIIEAIRNERETANKDNKTVAEYNVGIDLSKQRWLFLTTENKLPLKTQLSIQTRSLKNKADA